MSLSFKSSGVPGFSARVADDPRHRQARKRERQVQVRFTDITCTVQTMEGIVHAKPGDAILTDQGGNHWRVSKGRFPTAYRPSPDTQSGEDGTYLSRPSKVLVLQSEAPFEVLLADGVSLLKGKAGDWLVDYGDGSLGIVAQSVFSETYDLLS